MMHVEFIHLPVLDREFLFAPASL